MKKIVLGVVAAGMLALAACNTDDTAVNNTSDVVIVDNSASGGHGPYEPNKPAE